MNLLNKKSRLLAGVIVLVALLGGGLWAYWQSTKVEELTGATKSQVQNWCEPRDEDFQKVVQMAEFLTAHRPVGSSSIRTDWFTFANGGQQIIGSDDYTAPSIGKGLYVYNIDGSDKRQLTFPKYVATYTIDSSPKILGDGSKVIFKRLIGNTLNVYDGSGHHPVLNDWQRVDLMSLDLVTESVSLLHSFDATKLEIDTDFQVSPDEQWAVFTADNVHGEPNPALYLMDIEGSRVKKIMSGGWISQPVWSADSKQVTFLKDNDTYVVNIDGGGLKKITKVCES